MFSSIDHHQCRQQRDLQSWGASERTITLRAGLLNCGECVLEAGFRDHPSLLAGIRLETSHPVGSPLPPCHPPLNCYPDMLKAHPAYRSVMGASDAREMPTSES